MVEATTQKYKDSHEAAPSRSAFRVPLIEVKAFDGWENLLAVIFLDVGHVVVLIGGDLVHSLVVDVVGLRGESGHISVDCPPRCRYCLP